MSKERLSYHDIRHVATTIVELLREEPDDQRAVLLLLDHLLIFQGRIQQMTLEIVRADILDPLLRGVEERELRLRSKPS